MSKSALGRVSFRLKVAIWTMMMQLTMVLWSPILAQIMAVLLSKGQHQSDQGKGHQSQGIHPETHLWLEQPKSSSQ